MYELNIFKRNLIGQVNAFNRKKNNKFIGFKELHGFYNTAKKLEIERVWKFQLNEKGLLGSAGARASLMYDNFDLSKPANQKIDIVVTATGYKSLV